MNSNQLLGDHASVQALNIITTQVNPQKVAYHNRSINHRGFTTTSAVNAFQKGGSRFPKGQIVQATRNENNIRAAAVAASQAKRMPIPVNKRPAPMDPTVSEVALLRALQADAPAVPQPEDMTRLTPQALARKRRNTPSLVTSVASFTPRTSQASSYTEYSCSCCNPRPRSVASSTAPSRLSSASASASAYDHMTSVSQRIGGSVAPSSVNTGKLRQLEEELVKERADRQRTQKELSAIRERQTLLMSRLSEAELGKMAELLDE
jgi:hypothetical protein